MNRQRQIESAIAFYQSSSSPLDSPKERNLRLGRAMEELARPLLEQTFKGWLCVSHCDATTDTKKAGKKCLLPNGTNAVLPDYQFCKKGQNVLIDVKSKHAHSYYHKSKDLQQFVDEWALNSYLNVAAAVGGEAWILIHLWPERARTLLNKPAINTGSFSLTPEQLSQLQKNWPTDDYYYAVAASDFLQYGRRGKMFDKDGYFLPIWRMIPGKSPGRLPEFQQERRVA